MKRSSFNPWKGLCVLVCIASAYSIIAAPQKKSSTKKVPTVKASMIKKALLPIAGIWMIRNGDKFDGSSKLLLNKDGTFLFAGSSWKSSGTYDLREGKLVLSWLSVDGAKVKPGSMRREIQMTQSLDGFTIDRFTYGKRQ